MDRTLLSKLICPKCLGNKLVISSCDIEVLESESNVVLEGTIACEKCKSNYPILLGIPLLVSNLKSYITNNRNEIMMSLHEENASKSSIDYINNISSLSIYGSGGKLESWESPQGINTYIYNQYDQKIYTDNEFLKPPYDGYNLYKYVAECITKIASSKDNVLVDIGCGTGGMTYYLRDFFNQAICIDYSFTAILQAQRLLSGIPSRKTSYDRYTSSQSKTLCDIDVYIKNNINYIVADATNIPLESGVSDICTSINILEVVSDSSSMIEGISKICKSGSLYINVTPFYWRHDRSSVESWITDKSNNDSSALLQFLSDNDFTVIEENKEAPWYLKFYERYYQLWITHLSISKKS